MKRTIVIAASALTLTSCTEVYFEVAQPAGVKAQSSFPLEIQGNYITEDNDTIRIGEITYHTDDETDNDFANGEINDEVVLKKYKKNYFLNFKQENGLWEVVVLSVDKNNEIQAYYIDGGKKELVNKMKDLIAVKDVLDDEGKIDYYIINPSKKELRNLIKEEVFEKVGSFRKMEED